MTLGELLEILGAAACATDSGRPRCPLCGRWARPEDVGQIGGRFESPNGVDNDCDGGIDVDSKTDGKRRCGRPGRDWSKVPLGQKPERDIAAELGVPLGTVLTALRRRAITRYRPEPEAARPSPVPARQQRECDTCGDTGEVDFGLGAPPEAHMGVGPCPDCAVTTPSQAVNPPPVVCGQEAPSPETVAAVLDAGDAAFRAAGAAELEPPADAAAETPAQLAEDLSRLIYDVDDIDADIEELDRRRPALVEKRAAVRRQVAVRLLALLGGGHG